LSFIPQVTNAHRKREGAADAEAMERAAEEIAAGTMAGITIVTVTVTATVGAAVGLTGEDKYKPFLNDRRF
jgi:multidrug efflux pump subunit AcrB